MKTTITIRKVEAKYGSFGKDYLLVGDGDGNEFRVADTAQNRRAYVLGRLVDVSIEPRKSR